MISSLSLICLAYPQIDPTEKLDPEVEDILADIAEDFVESVSSSHHFVFPTQLYVNIVIEFTVEKIMSSGGPFFLTTALCASFYPDHNVWLFFSKTSKVRYTRG